MSWIGKVIRFFEGATNHPPVATHQVGPSPADYDAALRDHERQIPKDEETPRPRP